MRKLRIEVDLEVAEGAEDRLFHDRGMRAVAHAVRQYAHGIEVLQYIPEQRIPLLTWNGAVIGYAWIDDGEPGGFHEG